MGKNINDKSRTTRRGFMAAAAAFASFTIVPRHVLAAAGKPTPNDRLNIGCIGVGDRGRYLLESALQGNSARVVAVCDVKADCREKARQMVNSRYENEDCVACVEHEQIVERDDIDACLIASCDHWHALHSLAATKAGKGVYCEKPLSVSMEQNQTLRAAVREHKTVFQFGTQQRSDAKFLQACELVRNGRIGELKKINVWSPASVSGGPTEVVPVPANLDYERWLGPAPFTPYTKDRDSNAWWWFIEDYALGFIAGWGIHPLDIALWGAGDLMRAPVVVEGEGVFPMEGLCNTATAWKIALKYDSGIEIDYRSEPAPEEWVARYGLTDSHGTAFEGTEGWVAVNRGAVTSSPAELATDKTKDDEIRLYKSRHHIRDFIDSVRDGSDPASPIEEAVDGDAICHICDIAIRLKRPVRWNPAVERFEKDAEADARLTRPIRAPWAV
ncbi:MAG TPA: Gfo/Idh/MocA family oxidoreductase [Candidatus Hydrogenedentes bacterium]|nr:Gfo/Idh/MocA family oxidoreductase [Candidatus Hydrogenedentota bacterium]